jgi:GT2 family glycosyltransferase
LTALHTNDVSDPSEASRGTAETGGRPRDRISVVVPTYKRTSDLGRCLDALALQTRLPDRVLVVCRDTDEESNRFLAARLASAGPQLEIVNVSAPGQVAALNAGLERVSDGIISFTDDDAAPRPQWLARIESHFALRPDVGGVGGRDYVHGDGSRANPKRVGVIEWFGRPVGNHHRGSGPARDVDVLKGANMSFRVSALADVRFDDRLRGEGAQRNNDLAFSLAVRKRGWKIIYDPEVAVDHYPGDRVEGVDRSELSARVIRESAYNETLAVLEYLPGPARPVFLLWATLVGTRVLPGVVQSVRNASKHPKIWNLFAETVKARFQAAGALRGPARS